jgi:two-component system C4-dicarboxylate transport sensor histidine kinase DctB
LELAIASTGALAAAHKQFARAVLWLYAGAASIALVLVFFGLLADKRYDEERARQRLLLETQSRARYFGQHLRLLSEELRRLGTRSEIDLLDDDLRPERSLLEVSHADSTFFNLGVAIDGASGDVLWSHPRSVLGGNRSLGRTGWFNGLRLRPGLTMVAVDPNETDAIVYVVAPVVRNSAFTGAIVGGVDLAKGQPVDGKETKHVGQTVLATSRGDVILPPVPPAYAQTGQWRSLFSNASATVPIHETALNDVPHVVAMAAVGNTGFMLATVAARAELLEPAATRLRTRLLLALSLTLAPLFGLVYLFRRSLSTFRRSEEAAVREDRLRRLGEASNLIAHEVRNSLNGLRIGLDLILQNKRSPQDRVVIELRAEIERLSSFAHQLMLFAKDPKPVSADADLSEIVNTALSLTIDLADELGVRVDVLGTEHPVPVVVDSVLIRIVLSNLISNSLDALSTVHKDGAPPHLWVSVDENGGHKRVRVSDNGPGVPAALAQTLFEPFVTSKPSGVGIGLALARKIARAHGGDLRLESEGPGASFVLELKAG